jgi:hypothetical protein
MEQLHVPVFGNLIGGPLRHSVWLNVISDIPIHAEILYLLLGIRRAKRRNPSLLQPPSIVSEIDGTFCGGNLKDIQSIRRETLTEVRILSGTFDHKRVHSQNFFSSAKTRSSIIDDRLFRRRRTTHKDKQRTE